MTAPTTRAAPLRVKDPERPRPRVRVSTQLPDPADRPISRIASPVWRSMTADQSLSQAVASWFSAEMAPVRYRYRRSEYGLAIADLWRSWERSGRIKNDPYGCQLDHVRAVQTHILGAQRRGLWQEPIDLARYAFPWYARLSIGVVRFLERAIFPALYVFGLLFLIYR